MKEAYGMKTHIFAAIALVLILGTGSNAAIKTETVGYDLNGVKLNGFLAYDDSKTSKQPGIVIVHDWDGIDAYEQMRARMLAELGYVAYCVDIYAKGVNPKIDNPGAEAGKYYADVPLLRSRVQSGVDFLKKHQRVNASKIGAMGNCFGGMTVLELARSGADIQGVISFHGALKTSQPASKGGIKTELLILHGQADPHVSPADVGAFHQELLNAGVGYKFIAYEGALHSFTKKGSDYNEAADKASWQEMKEFWRKVF